MEEFIANVGNVFSFDLTHEVSGATEGKFSGIVENLIGGAIFLAIIVAITFVTYCVIRFIEKKKSVIPCRPVKKMQFLTIAICVSEAIQIVYWVIL